MKKIILKPDTYYLQDETISLYYASISYHRNGTRLNEKSQWEISIEDEFELFNTNYSNVSGYFDNHVGWGVSYTQDADKCIVNAIGRGTSKETLYFVKYLDGGKDNKWHGYPANYMLNIHDKPSSHFLTAIYNEGIISKPQFAKIKKGKRCDL